MTDNKESAPKMTSEKAKDEALKWLLSQGSSTVILICILSYLAYSVHTQVPKHLEAIQDGYALQEQRFLQALEQRDSKLTDALKQISDSHDRDRELFIRLLDIKTAGEDRVSYGPGSP